MDLKKGPTLKQPNDSKKASRRKFLATGAAAALGAARSTPGQASHPGPETKSLKDLIAYGGRSEYVKSIRIPVDERPSPDEFGLTFHVLTPLQDQLGIITPSVASLHRDASRIDRPEYRSQTAPAADPRHGGPAAGVHDGRSASLSFGVTSSFYRVPGESFQSDG